MFIPIHKQPELDVACALQLLCISTWAIHLVALHIVPNWLYSVPCLRSSALLLVTKLTYMYKVSQNTRS